MKTFAIVSERTEETVGEGVKFSDGAGCVNVDGKGGSFYRASQLDWFLNKLREEDFRIEWTYQC